MVSLDIELVSEVIYSYLMLYNRYIHRLFLATDDNLRLMKKRKLNDRAIVSLSNIHSHFVEGRKFDSFVKKPENDRESDKAVRASKIIIANNYSRMKKAGDL